MSTETEEITGSTRNGDNTNTITTESGSCDVANESIRNPSIEEKIVSKMFSCSRETICLILAVTFSLAFAALHSAPPKISKPPAAKPFFHQNSVIIDFYKGQLNAMIERGSDADLNFVMYYAPWDAESQMVRHEFERVAHYYHSKIFFSAINCWQPGSECRNQYSKIQSYPVLVLYPTRGTGIQYKGIYSAPYIMRFLNAYLKPIHRISNRKDLTELLIDNDSVLVGFFDFKGPAVSLGYREFYKAAIRALEKDPNRDVIFAAVTSANVATVEFNIEHTPSASLYLWNESLEKTIRITASLNEEAHFEYSKFIQFNIQIYPEDKLWTSENLLHWMERSVHKVSLWLQPPGVKSSTLAPYLHDGPVMLLFTPRNPLHATNYNHDLLREIALEYYSCGDDVLAGQLTKRLRLKRKNSMEQHREKRKQCLEITDDAMIQPPPPLPVSISIQQWINDSCCAQVYINKCLLCERDNSPKNNVCNIALSKIDEFCKRNDIFKVLDTPNSEEHYFCCDNYRLSEPNDPQRQYFSSRINENDSRSAIAVRLRYIQDDCTNFLAGDKYHYPIFPEESKEQYSTVKLDTSACDMNRTMAFLSIDSLNYHHFAEGLGINVLQMRDKTAVVILDSLRESQYLMSEKLSRNSLVKFINNYNNGSLSRTLRSNEIRQYGRDLKVDLCKNKKSSKVCIEELNTETFLNTILNPTKDVVVMYHSPYCAFCSAVSFVYLTVGNLLSKVNHIVFVRIDGDSNDLPWEYSMNQYPSILFFPAKRKEDSTIFSASLPITVPNLLNFILANLESDTHIEALINICNKGSGEPPDNCVSRIRRYCLEVIHNYLKNYRKLLRHSSNSRQFNSKLLNKRHEILLKLEHIRDIHLTLSVVEDLKKDVEKYNELINKFHIYYKNLNMIKTRTIGVYMHETIALKKQKYINDEL